MANETISKIIPGMMLDAAGYHLTGLKPPGWVSRFDDACAGEPFKVTVGQEFRATGTLCIRIGDLDRQRIWLEHALNPLDNAWRAAAIASTHLVGYFTAAKALLDAGAVALTAFHQMDLGPGDQDFRKSTFWKALKATNEDAHQVLVKYQSMVFDIVAWRDHAIHRHPPRVRVLSDGPPKGAPDEILLREVKVGVPSQPGVDVFDVLFGAKIDWKGPLELVDEFHGPLHAISKDVASIIFARLNEKAVS